LRQPDLRPGHRLRLHGTGEPPTPPGLRPPRSGRQAGRAGGPLPRAGVRGSVEQVVGDRAEHPASSVERYSALASAVAGRRITVECSDAGIAYTDGQTIYVPDVDHQ